jgi:5-formyltetrahydrofolate cyclo-ligase
LLYGLYQTKTIVFAMNPHKVEHQKKTLRQEMLEKRAKFPKATKELYDQWICERLETIIQTEGYQVIHAYLPMGKEINIAPLLENLLAKNITVVTPKTLPKRMLENRVLRNMSEVEAGVFGTTHPKKAEIYEGPFDLIIVPGLAFDQKNYRLGYGGGYYDTFLAQHPEAFKLGICYPFQKTNPVPIEAHDLSLDQVLTKK